MDKQAYYKFLLGYTESLAAMLEDVRDSEEILKIMELQLRVVRELYRLNSEE